MKQLLFFALFLIFTSCSKGFRSRYYDTCMQSAKQHYKMDEYNNKATAEKLCNCMADKLAAKYRSEEEMYKDAVNAAAINEGCMREQANQK